jgi:hypothetical protein
MVGHILVGAGVLGIAYDQATKFVKIANRVRVLK